MSGWVGLESLMTAEEVAEILRAPSTKTVARLRQQGKLAGVRVGRGYRYAREDVEDCIGRLRAAGAVERWANEAEAEEIKEQGEQA